MLTKKQPYKLLKIFILSAMTIPVFQACGDKDDDKTLVQHDTTYTFEPNDLSALYPTHDKIKASADSAEVRYVIIKAIKNWSLMSPNGINIIIENGLKPAFEAAHGKARGAGKVNNDNMTEEAATWLLYNGYSR